MQSKNSGFLLFRKLIKDNDLFIKILLKDDKLISGIVYGGNSSKKNHIYQVGYYLTLNLKRKNLNNPYIIEAEIDTPLIGSIINDKYKLYCLLSIVSIINLSIIEGQTVKGLFICINDFINILIKKKNWIKFYCLWLFSLLKVIGYEIDYKSNSEKLFYDLEFQEFLSIKRKNSLKFPHAYLTQNSIIDYTYLDTVFIIFEYIFKNNHLNNSNYKLPDNYINFKKLILEYNFNN